MTQAAARAVTPVVSSVLAGKVAVVTGAASGIGAACAAGLAAAGAALALFDLDAEGVRTRASEFAEAGTPAVGYPVDVADESAVDAATEAVVRDFGHLDIAVNSAGISVPTGATADQSTEQWRRVLSVNLDGVFFCMRAQLRQMRQQGAGVITNIGSVLSAVAMDPGAAAYTAAKHGVVGLTRSAAVSHAVDGIRVNAVGPGFIDTPMVRARLGAHPERLDARIAAHPIGRLGRADEVAALVTWLSSEQASFVTGAFYPVDGGYLAV